MPSVNCHDWWSRSEQQQTQLILTEEPGKLRYRKVQSTAEAISGNSGMDAVEVVFTYTNVAQ